MLMHVLLVNMQPFNVLRYENGQHYDAHYDVFDPESYGPQTSQRVWLCSKWSANMLACRDHIT